MAITHIVVTLITPLLHHSPAVTFPSTLQPSLSKARGLPMLVTSEEHGTGATHVTIVTTVNTRHPAHRGSCFYTRDSALNLSTGALGALEPGYNLGPGALPASRLTYKALIT